jgi:hypothetical protein
LPFADVVDVQNCDAIGEEQAFESVLLEVRCRAAAFAASGFG